MILTADFKKPLRPIGKLNGTNNGPLMNYTDRTAEYHDMGVDFVRFHETNAHDVKCVEVPFVFPDFDADENDPANYYFAETDAVMQAAVDAGMEIMYRLGMGTEGTAPKLFVVVPKDYAKWARICEHIIRHYNEGWADGFHFGIEYWEIWNEADIKPYWPGPREEYLKLYEVASNYLKGCFPNLKFGNCGWAGIKAHGYFAPDPKTVTPAELADYEDRQKTYLRLFEMAKNGEAPLDFFAWHTYAVSSDKTELRCKMICDMLKDYGLENTEVINTEWSSMSLSRDSHKRWDYSQLFQMHCAAALMTSMIVMQKHGVSKAAYYDADDRSNFCGLFDFDRKLPHYFGLKAFSMLRAGQTEVATDGDSKTLRMCASYNGKKAVLLLANEGETEKVTLKLENLPESDYVVTVFDETHELKPVRRGRFTGKPLHMTVKKDSFAVVEFDCGEGR